MFLFKIARWYDVLKYARRFHVSYPFAALLFEANKQLKDGAISHYSYYGVQKVLRDLYPADFRKICPPFIVRGDQIDGPCSIIALRKMLEDPDWAPEEYVECLKKKNRDALHEYFLMEKYAPVRWYTRRHISKVVQSLNADTLICIGYKTPTGGHMECIKVKDFPKYAKDEIQTIVVRV